MLERTFVLVPGIGARTERLMWEAGAADWKSYLASPAQFPLSPALRARTPSLLQEAQARLAAGDAEYFAARLNPRDHWRTYPDFAGRVMFLDIETDGGRSFESVTLIGCHRDGETRLFQRGEDLLDFPDYFAGTAVLVTFFGTGFDLPVLKDLFPKLPTDLLHFDLCPVFRRLGMRGGLKQIERDLGLVRPDPIASLSGRDAVLLWNRWRWGSREALELLREYNRADVENMIPLAELAYREMWGILTRPRLGRGELG